MKFLRFSAIAVAFCATATFLAAEASAVTITTADGNGADTYLTNDGNSSGTTPHGTEGAMEFRDLVGVRFRALYMRFDISSVSGPIQDAQITINGTTINRNRDLLFMGLIDGSPNENWDEATTTYDSASGFGSATDDGTFTLDGNLTAELARTSGSVLGLNTTNLSTDLDAFLNADTDGLVTFAVYSIQPWNQSEDFYFSTKEAGTVNPSLTFTVIPEPAACLLLGLAGIVGLTLRKRSV